MSYNTHTLLRNRMMEMPLRCGFLHIDAKRVKESNILRNDTMLGIISIYISDISDNSMHRQHDDNKASTC